MSATVIDEFPELAGRFGASGRDVLRVPPAAEGLRRCRLDGCEREHAARGYCALHYYRVKRSGAPGPVEPLVLTPVGGLTLAEHLWAYVDRTVGDSECWLFTGWRYRAGYGALQHDNRRMMAHRAAWEVTYGPIPAGMAVRHQVCDNPPCVNPSHLRLGTHERNMRDKVEHGRQFRPSGEGNGQARVTKAQVGQIRRRYAAGALQRELAEEFGIAQSQVSAIVRGKAWAA